jgi:diguanylate cyclase (GGDEF)-like protein/PAS domain S-box-containing protein
VAHSAEKRGGSAGWEGCSEADRPGPLLIVGESPSDATLLRELLVDEGWTRQGIVMVENLRQARETLTTGRYAAILLDLSPADSRGLEGVAVLAAAAPEVPIVVVTAHPGDSVVVAALVEGADEFVTKRDLNGGVAAAAIHRAVGRRLGKRRVSEEVSSHVFDSVEAPTVVLDGQGRILATNRAWSRSAEAGGADLSAVGPGVNYLHVCDAAEGDGAEGAGDAAAGIRAVLQGDADSCSLDYPCSGLGAQRWFSLRVSPLGPRGGGAVVTHLDITELKEAERRLRGDRAELAGVTDESAPIYALIDSTGIVRAVSPATQYLFGLRPEEAVGTSAFDRIDPRDLEVATLAFADAVAKPDHQQRVQIRARDKHNRWHDLDLVVINFLDDERVSGIVVTGADVTSSRLAQIARRLGSRLLQRLPASVVVVDDRGIIVYWNDRATSLYGIGAQEALGRPIADLDIGPTDRSRSADIVAALETVGHWEGDYDAGRPGGGVIPIYATLERVDDADIGFSGIVATTLDITGRRQLETDLAFAALHDPLTGLPNRRLLVDHLEGALARSRRNGTLTAVLFIDLDRFKDINDLAGHAAGDAVLLTVAEYLTGLVRSGDIVARLGGDEFVVCCEAVKSAAEALQVAERIQQVLLAPFRVDRRSFQVSASIGVAMSTPGSHADALVRKADAAMYAAKEAGRQRVELFDDAMHELARSRHETATELAQALSCGRVQVFYQPEIRITTGELAGFEALARWRHPTRGLIPPDEFIPAAEQSGLIGRLGSYVLQESCRALAEWRALAPERDLKVAVNVSVRQLIDPEFPKVVADAITAAGIPAGRLCLEVTESALLDEALADHSLRALKAVGVQIAIDDFGTGYSSLSRLRRFPVDFLKVDRSFVDGMGANPEDDVIVASVVSLAHSLGLEIIAEGVETEAQLKQLALLGCEMGQGWLWERAVAADRATAYVVALDNWTRASSDGATPGTDPAENNRTIDSRVAVAMLLHELAGPLRVLSGFAELLAEDADPARRDMAVQAIARNAGLARMALAAVADVSYLDTGRLHLSAEDILLPALVDDAVQLARQRAGHEVNFDLAVQELGLVGDPQRLTGALTNLFTNARKFSPPDSTVRVWSELRAQDGRVVIHVADEGPGIPPDSLGVIFRKFGRVNHDRPGSGLGLYLARGVARAHGGELTYRQAAGGGAHFVLELPGGQPPVSGTEDGAAGAVVTATPAPPGISPPLRGSKGPAARGK